MCQQILQLKYVWKNRSGVSWSPADMALNVRGGQGIPPGPEKGNEKIKKQRAGFFLFQVWRINTGQVVSAESCSHRDWGEGVRVCWEHRSVTQYIFLAGQLRCQGWAVPAVGAGLCLGAVIQVIRYFRVRTHHFVLPPPPQERMHVFREWCLTSYSAPSP